MGLLSAVFSKSALGSDCGSLLNDITSWMASQQQRLAFYAPALQGLRRSARKLILLSADSSTCHLVLSSLAIATFNQRVRKQRLRKANIESTSLNWSLLKARAFFFFILFSPRLLFIGDRRAHTSPPPF